MKKKLRNIIEAKAIRIYEIGYAHGGNPLRSLQGKKSRMESLGWGAECDDIIKAVEDELKKSRKK